MEAICQLRLASVDGALAEVGDEAPPWLTPEERLRLSAISAPLRRRQYLAGHWLARFMAAEHFGGKPSEWSLVVTASGHRQLMSHRAQPLHLSIAHCGERLACAVASHPIGVDLELPRKPRDYEALSQQVFSPEECERFRAADPPQREPLFFLHWTLKEAQGKRSGHGLRPEHARRWIAQASAESEAEAIAWTVATGSLAVAGPPGLRVAIAGLESAAAPTHWRFTPSPTGCAEQPL